MCRCRSRIHSLGSTWLIWTTFASSSAAAAGPPRLSLPAAPAGLDWKNRQGRGEGPGTTATPRSPARHSAGRSQHRDRAGPQRETGGTGPPLSRHGVLDPVPVAVLGAPHLDQAVHGPAAVLLVLGPQHVLG